MRKVEQQSTHADERGANGPSPIAPSQHGEREAPAAFGGTSLRRDARKATLRHQETSDPWEDERRRR